MASPTRPVSFTPNGPGGSPRDGSGGRRRQILLLTVAGLLVAGLAAPMIALVSDDPEAERRHQPETPSKPHPPRPPAIRRRQPRSIPVRPSGRRWRLPARPPNGPSSRPPPFPTPTTPRSPRPTPGRCSISPGACSSQCKPTVASGSYPGLAVPRPVRVPRAAGRAQQHRRHPHRLLDHRRRRNAQRHHRTSHHWRHGHPNTLNPTERAPLARTRGTCCRTP